MRLVLRLRSSVASLSCRPLRDLCYTFVVVAVASALLTYHLSRQLPPSTLHRRADDDDRRAAMQRYRRRAGDRPVTGTDTSVDVRQVLEGLDQDGHWDPVHVKGTSWNDHHDDDFDSIDNEVSECNTMYNVDSYTTPSQKPKTTFTLSEKCIYRTYTSGSAVNIHAPV